MFGTGEWNDAVDGHFFTAQYLIEWDGSGTLGTNYCMANMNSQGLTGRMSAEGSLTVTDNDLTLKASDIAPNAFGFFITSETEGFVAHPGGSAGNLCLGGAIGRFVGAGQIKNSGPNAEIDVLIDLTDIPTPLGPVSMAPGQTRSFQLWHRDASAGGTPTSNFTNGLRITFN